MKTVLYRGGDVSEDTGSGAGGEIYWGVVARGEARRGGAGGRWWRSRGRSRRNRRFKAETYILTKEEGGRHTPFFNGYRPQVLLSDDGCDGRWDVAGGVEMVMPRGQCEFGRWSLITADSDGEGV